MEKKIILMKVNGERVELPDAELETLQKAVGGYIEIVPSNVEDHVLIVNEEGRINDLPFNESATKVLRYGYGNIVGDAVLLHNDLLK